MRHYAARKMIRIPGHADRAPVRIPARPKLDPALLCACVWEVAHTPGAGACQRGPVPSAGRPGDAGAAPGPATGHRRSIGFAPVALLPVLDGGGSNAQGGTIVHPRFWWW